MKPTYEHANRHVACSLCDGDIQPGELMVSYRKLAPHRKFHPLCARAADSERRTQHQREETHA